MFTHLIINAQSSIAEDAILLPQPIRKLNGINLLDRYDSLYRYEADVTQPVISV